MNQEQQQAEQGAEAPVTVQDVAAEVRAALDESIALKERCAENEAVLLRFDDALRRIRDDVADLLRDATGEMRGGIPMPTNVLADRAREIVAYVDDFRFSLESPE